MPIYEYRRPDGSTFEVLQAFTDPPLEHDPETGVAVERVLHAPAVHFKGKGFYNTDYGTRKRQRETSSSNESAASSNGSGSEKASSGEGSTSTSGGASEGSSEKKDKPSGDKAKAEKTPASTS